MGNIKPLEKAFVRWTAILYIAITCTYSYILVDVWRWGNWWHVAIIGTIYLVGVADMWMRWKMLMRATSRTTPEQ